MKRVALLALAPLLAAAPPARIEVTGTRFLAQRASEAGLETVESNRIAHAPGESCYRWEIDHKPRPGVRALRERLTLPAPAISWGGVDGNPESASKVAKNRDLADTELILPLTTGTIGNGWCVAEGDPRGRYSIEVFDGRRRLKRFDFRVE